MGFSISELFVVLLVALLVIKPEQLPEVAYALGRLIQAMRRFMGNIKSELNALVDGMPISGEQKREP